MFHLDGYATAYGIALAFTLAVAFWLGGCARVKGTALLICAWFTTLAVQNLFRDNTVTLVFATMDACLFLAFWGIAFFFNRTWAQLVAGLHAIMLGTHAIYVWRGETEDFVYLSILAGLGYLAMAIIAGPPLIRKGLEWLGKVEAARGLAEITELKRFVRGRDLPASAFRGKKKTGEGGGP